MENLYQLTDKEKAVVDAHRTADEMGQSLIECAAQTAVEIANKPQQTAEVIDFSKFRKE